MSESQKHYISKMTKDNPSLPPFTGKTKLDAAKYIEDNKKVNYGNKLSTA